MKRYTFLFVAVFLVFGLTYCNTDNTAEEIDIPDVPGQVDPENPEKPTPEEMANDPRLSSFNASGVWWLRRPTKHRSFSFNIAEDDPIAEYCNQPGWAYMFYDDGAVIGYEPFPDRIDLMQYAVWLTVTSHNVEFPDSQWGYINVPPVSAPPPVTEFDPVLGKWQFALCIDDGTIVDGPYTAEYDWEWQGWKDGIARQIWELYNRDHDPDAHIVWGTDE